jgi:hypothetical protein
MPADEHELMRALSDAAGPSIPARSRSTWQVATGAASAIRRKPDRRGPIIPPKPDA